jgi:hypothetical protein
MTLLRTQVPDPSAGYVHNFKVRLLERLFSEQIEALSRADKLSELERNHYEARKSQIARLSQDLGLERARDN